LGTRRIGQRSNHSLRAKKGLETGMSKTTNRNGKPKYTMVISVEANPKPSFRLKRQWEKLDKYAQKEFSKAYDALTDQEKVKLHFNINTGKYQEKKTDVA
jgi:hypothetical protein